MHFYLELVSIFQHLPRCFDLSLEPDKSRYCHHSGRVDPHGDDWQSHMHSVLGRRLATGGFRPHTSPLYICRLFRSSSLIYPSRQWLDPERLPLAIAIALGYAPSDFGPSTQTV